MNARDREMISKGFVTAGRAVFTIEGPTGHYTFRVEKVAGNDRYPADAYFTKILTGPDNTADFTYIGKLDPTTGAVTTTAKSKHHETTFPFRLLNRVLARVWAGDHAAYAAHGYKTYHEGKCGRCGRALTVPSSVESGIGPECAKRGAAKKAVRFEVSERPGFNVAGLTAHHDAEGEVTHWTGTRNGVEITAFND